MSWLNVFGLTGLSLLLLFSMLRVERRALWLVLLLLVLPAAALVGRWATVGAHWPEVALGFGLAATITGAWWLSVGRRLPAVSSDNIRVWGQEAGPRPRAEDAAALQAEVRRLKEEAARMEAEIRRLKGSDGSQG